MRFNKVLTATLASGLLLSYSTAFGQAKTPAAKPAAAAPAAAAPAAAPAKSAYRAAYGMGGCGLGALVFGNDNAKWKQIVAVILNGIYGNQTFAITSGTSKCTKGSASSAAMEQEVFVSSNLSTLQKDAAQGSGETLVSFAEVLGCQVQSNEFAKLSQSQYSYIFEVNDPQMIVTRVREAIKADSSLAGVCSRAG